MFSVKGLCLGFRVMLFGLIIRCNDLRFMVEGLVYKFGAKCLGVCGVCSRELASGFSLEFDVWGL